MKRLTRKADTYPCRIADGCPIEDWVLELGCEGDICGTCPVEKYINTLAMYEDMVEQLQSIVGMLKIIMED